MSDVPKQYWKIQSGHRISLNLLLQRDDSESDKVILQAKNEEFPAHRSILSAFSDYFLKMFTIDMKEKHSKVIKIEDVTAEALKEILKAMYDGEIGLTEDNLAEILHASSLMQVTCVLDVAAEYMNHNMSGEKWRVYLELANLYSLEAVQTTAIQCHLQNFDKISDEESILNLPINQIEVFLQSDQLITKGEERVFQFILKWVKKDLEHRRQYFPQLFKHVRLQFIPIKYVVTTMGEHELVKQFNECVNLVLDAVSFHIAPTTSVSTKPRRFSPDPDSLIILPYNKKAQFMYNLHTKESKQLSSAGLPSKGVLMGCAVANKSLVTVLCGGCISHDISSKEVFRFDGLTWCKLPSMNVARCGGAAVFHNEKLYVFGGETTPVSNSAKFEKGKNNPYAFTLTGTFETFEEEKQEWRNGEFDPNVRSYGAAVAYKNQIFLIGGYKPTNLLLFCDQEWKLCKEACSEVLVYNPMNDSWKEDVRINKPRAEFGCALWGSSVYVVGGFSQVNNQTRKSLESMEFRDLNNHKAWTVIKTNFSYYRFGNQMPLAGIGCSIDKKMYTFCDGMINRIDINLQKTPKECDVFKEENLSFCKSGLLIPFTNRYVTNLF